MRIRLLITVMRHRSFTPLEGEDQRLHFEPSHLPAWLWCGSGSGPCISLLMWIRIPRLSRYDISLLYGFGSGSGFPHQVMGIVRLDYRPFTAPGWASAATGFWLWCGADPDTAFHFDAEKVPTVFTSILIRIPLSFWCRGGSGSATLLKVTVLRDGSAESGKFSEFCPSVTTLKILGHLWGNWERSCQQRT
jgi:hypothetical protein